MIKFNISGQTFFEHISETYGHQTTSIFRHCIKQSQCIIKNLNHLHYMLTCKKEKWIPPSFTIKPKVITQQGKKIAIRASWQFINAAITNVHQKLKSHRSLLHHSCQQLHRQTNNNDFKHCLTFMHIGNLNLTARLKKTQDKKLNRLRTIHKEETRTTPSEKNNWIINKSSKILTEPQKDALKLGLNFAITPNHIDIPAMLASIENISHLIPPEEIAGLRAKITKILHGARMLKPNITRETQESIKELAHDDTITIVRADKGKAIVIYDTNTYHDAVTQLLTNKDRYLELKQDTNLKFQRKLNQLISCYENTGLITKEKAKTLKCYTSTTPRFYGIPKIHKIGSPLRPITAYYTSPVAGLTNYLYHEIQGILQPSIHSLESTQAFVKEIQQYNIKADEIMASFDVKDLYTSIPHDLASELVYELSYTHKPIDHLHNSWILKLLTFVLNCNTVTHNGKYYQQTCGLPMGSKLSGLLAELTMRHIENKIIKANPEIQLWRRYIDDVFLITKEEDIIGILDLANKVNKHIQFTVELENKNFELPFLDVICTRKTGQINTSVYRKPTNTGKYLNYTSNHHHSQIMAACRFLYNRCETHCNTTEAITQERRKIHHDLILNDYPENIIQRYLKQERKRTTYPIRTPVKWIKTVRLQYYHNITEKIAKELSKWHIRTAYGSQRKIQQIINPHKHFHPENIWDKSNVIYQIPCQNCNKVYIGQTKRQLKTRITEHKRTVFNEDQKSLITHHCQEEKHTMNWNNVTILKSGLNTVPQRLFFEAWFTNISENPTINECQNIPGEYISLLNGRRKHQ